MPVLRAVAFDLWNTLVDYPENKAREAIDALASSLGAD